MYATFYLLHELARKDVYKRQIQISETMIVSWIVMILITGLCIWLTHDLKVENISKRQALAEMIVEQANKFVVGNMGEKFRHLIPFVAALFATSIVSNLISLIAVSYTHLDVYKRQYENIPESTI